MHRKQVDFDKMTRRFLTEGQLPSVASFIQSLEEVLTKLRPNTRTDERRVEIAKSHLKEIRRCAEQWGCPLTELTLNVQQRAVDCWGDDINHDFLAKDFMLRVVDIFGMFLSKCY